MNTAVSVSHIAKSYGSVHALQDVSFEVPYGTVLGLLGPNGAGKTTLVRIITTLLRADAGDAWVAGYNVREQADDVRSAIGLTGQYAAVDEYLTGRENLRLVGKLYHHDARAIADRTDELLQMFSLVDAADRPAKTYSGGMRRRLDIAMSLFNKPKVLFLDEPTTGLDPQSRIALWRIIKELVASGTTVLLTTQYLEEADHLADTIVVIDHGRVVAHGTPRDLKTQLGSDVLEVHLADASRTQAAVALLRPLAKDEPHVDAELGMISIPTARGSESLIEAVRQLDSAAIAIEDLTLRRPTLDDVFLNLTNR